MQQMIFFLAHPSSFHPKVRFCKEFRCGVSAFPTHSRLSRWVALQQANMHHSAISRPSRVKMTPNDAAATESLVTFVPLPSSHSPSSQCLAGSSRWVSAPA